MSTILTEMDKYYHLHQQYAHNERERTAKPLANSWNSVQGTLAFALSATLVSLYAN